MRHCTDDCNGLLHNELERTCTLCASVKFETVSPEQKAIAFEKVCPLLESIRYIVYKEPQNWQEARQFCNEKHRGLAIIRNIKEYESLKTVLQEADIRSHIWIGGNLVGSKWEWVSKSGPNIEMTYTKWTPQQPSGNGNCLQFWNDYQYDDDKCDLMKSFACVL
ncbi:hypothetical protein DPMN_008685 [Dreissena polymorpha]|uniref:C-type lectin domain-containing protein n=1 Tax=Dreissena polymorpha TaxID=45954 RepID=A0A9D4RXK4_DREPO|nr:hypothetical protein DPMN_008685 [Dreissena polymorpha]